MAEDDEAAKEPVAPEPQKVIEHQPVKQAPSSTKTATRAKTPRKQKSV
jgi:hypothetical protein